jgi:hypothetical protein
MIVKYKFEKSFGPVASFSGILIFLAGLAAVFYSLTGIVLIFLGAFIGFTYSGTSIDYENRRVMFSNNLFGIINTGKLISINDQMKIGISSAKKVYRTYSRSNRTLDIKVSRKKAILIDKNGKAIIPLMNISADNMQELYEMSRKLNLQVLK